MKYRLLGETGVKISEIGFGGAAISGEAGGYGFGDISENSAIDLIVQAYDMGINLFDTAPVYGFGSSEARIGKAFSKLRDKVFILDKCGVSWNPNKRIFMSNDPKLAVQMLEDSLRTLQTDYIDLYMIHWPDEKVDIRKCFEVLLKEKEKSKIKYLGLCNTTPEDIQKVLELDRIEAVQCEYSFFEHRNFLKLKDVLQKNQISFISWGGLDKGILSGRVNPKRVYDKSDCRSWAPWWKARDNQSKFETVEKLKKFVEKWNYGLLDLALNFALKEKEVSSVLVGARNSEQLFSIKNLRKDFLGDEALLELNRIYEDFLKLKK